MVGKALEWIAGKVKKTTQPEVLVKWQIRTELCAKVESAKHGVFAEAESVVQAPGQPIVVQIGPQLFPRRVEFQSADVSASRKANIVELIKREPDMRARLCEPGLSSWQRETP